MRVLVRIAIDVAWCCVVAGLALGSFASVQLSVDRVLVREELAARWPSPDGRSSIVALARSGRAVSKTTLFLCVEGQEGRSGPFFKTRYGDFFHTMDARWFSDSSVYVSLGSEPVTLQGERGGLRESIQGIDIEVGP